jgi:hypothetical protein
MRDAIGGVYIAVNRVDIKKRKHGRRLAAAYWLDPTRLADRSTLIRAATVC